MLSSAVSLSGILPLSKLFMIFHASGRMTKTTFLPKTVSLKGSRQSGKRKAIALPCDSSSTASKLLSLLEHWQFKPKIHSFSSSGFITNNSCLFPARRDLLTWNCWLFPSGNVIFSYHLYMYVASDSHSDLLVSPL